MPYTLAHPAAAVPLRSIPWIGSRWVLSALVIGSMVPDLGYSVRSLALTRAGHSLPGIFYLCVPLGLVALWILHVLLKRPMVLLLPDRHRAALWPLCGTFRFLPFSRFGWIVASLAAGAATHLAWDACTQRQGFVVSLFETMSRPIFVVGRHEVVVYDVLRHTCSAVGVLLLVYWYAAWLPDRRARVHDVHRSATEPPRGLVVSLLLVLPLVVGVFVGYWTTMGKFGLDRLEVFASRVALHSLGAFVMLACAYSIVYRLVEIAASRADSAHKPNATVYAQAPSAPLGERAG